MSAVYFDLQRNLRATSRGASLVLVARVLGDAGNHAQIAHISVRQILQRIGHVVQERQVKRLTHKLRDAGVIEIHEEHDENGAQLPNTYRLLTTWIRAQIDRERHRPPAPRASETAAQPVTPRGLWFSSWLTPGGGCRCSDVACEDCLAHG